MIEEKIHVLGRPHGHLYTIFWQSTVYMERKNTEEICYIHALSSIAGHSKEIPSISNTTFQHSLACRYRIWCCIDLPMHSRLQVPEWLLRSLISAVLMSSSK
jgi:hypothetical protein